MYRLARLSGGFGVKAPGRQVISGQHPAVRKVIVLRRRTKKSLNINGTGIAPQTIEHDLISRPSHHRKGEGAGARIVHIRLAISQSNQG